MYYTVKTSELDQHTHRFLWRDMESTREPDTYITQRVSFGDKPSGTIATIALRKTAEMTRDEHPQAADIIQSIIQTLTWTISSKAKRTLQWPAS